MASNINEEITVHTFIQRTVAGLSVLAVAFGLAIGLTTSLPSDALAKDNPTNPSNTNNCFYDGKEYSEGSIIVIGETEYRCWAGVWQKVHALPDPGPGWKGSYTNPAQEMEPGSYAP